MSSKSNRAAGSRPLLVWVVVFALVLGGFYGLDHLVMGMQGLPLNWDMTPAG